MQRGYGQKYCSDKCKWGRRRTYSPAALEKRRQYDRNRDLQRGKAKRERGKDHRRRARLAGAISEPYTLAEIAKRDHYRCGLCHKRVAMTKTVPHPKSPSIDHVIPLAAGGDDTKANVQLAHFLCNARKHIHGSQQLRLIG